MTLAYHIDVANRTVKLIEYTLGDRSFNRLLNCKTVGLGERIGDHDFALCDDEGLFHPCKAFWRPIGTFQPLPGDAVLVGPDRVLPNGDVISGDPTIGIEAFTALIEWMSHADFAAWIEAHKDQAAVAVNDEVIQTWGQVYAGMPKP